MSGVWTRNYTNCLAQQLGGANLYPSGSGATYANDNLSIRTYDGNYHAISSSVNFPTQFPYLANVAYHAPSRRHYSTGGTNAPFFCFGTGDTEASYDDYTIESAITNFTLSQGNVQVSKYVYDETSHTYSTTYRFVCQYTGSSEITINEMIIGTQMYFAGDYRYDGILYREVFDTPITVNQYESVVIELTQSFPLVNYEPYPT